MSSHKRRQYPQQQIAAYDVSAGTEGAEGPGYGYGGEAYQYADQGGVFVPAAGAASIVPTPNQVSDQLGQMNVGGGAYYGAYGGYPASGPAANPNSPGMASPYSGAAPAAAPFGAPAPSASQHNASFNDLQTVDMIQSMPPPVNDLDLPPPPLAVPIEQTITRSEYAQASPDYFRSTLNVIPSSPSLLKKSKLPLALVVRPFIGLRDSDEQIPLIEDMCIARCRRCRAYINPFAQYTKGDYRWQCNICGCANDVPQNFDWDVQSSKTKNRWERSELNYGIVDYVANSDYLARPPQPPTYVFLIDVSVNAVHNGMVNCVAETLRQTLHSLPNSDNCTRVAFIAVDGALNYFQFPLPNPLKPDERQDARMLVVSDLEDPFLPTNSGTLVNLTECMPVIERFLESLPSLFANTYSSNSAMGSALKASLGLVKSIGGKVVCITSSLPSVGLGKLQPRDERKHLGQKSEHQLLQPANNFYKSFAVDCNKAQVTVDMFLVSNNYQDVATLSNLPKYTAGSTFFYPGWSAKKHSDSLKLQAELGGHLSQELGFEGMFRARATTGLHPSQFSGHFFVRSSDLMTFPTVSRHHSYVIELNLDETIKKPYVTIQGAFLYTSSHTERRIRVMTMQVPVSDQLSAVYASADQQAIAMWFAHTASEKALQSGFDAAHELINTRIAEIFKVFRTDVLNVHTGTSSTLSLSSNLMLLPLLAYALKKNVGLRRNNQILSDIRANALDLLQTLPMPNLIKLLYPEFYALHELPDEAGLPDENGNIVLPQRLNLTGEVLQSHGLYLLDDGQVMFIWVGNDVVPNLLMDAFGVETLDEIPSGKYEMPVAEDRELNCRIRNLINASRQRNDTVYFPSLYFVHQNCDQSLKLWVAALLVEDRSESDPTYYQYLTTIRDNLAAK
ncbi:COPII subunit [Starmerella bacillaris]|uniref:COPII subunit n=1 Tax=Starmerella bacillaris TaxID=1247836 RepID=A0AAV5RP89_STABA|nr:COPII subunit [Starmerella bacillaris]